MEPSPVSAVVPMHLVFHVPGEAVPQGSAKAFMPKGWTRPIITGDNKKTKPWRAMVAASALDAADQQGTWPTLSALPIRLHIACYFVRPASVGERKRPMHTVKPDADKLARAILDSLTKVLWADDAQVVDVSITKAYAPAGQHAHTIIRAHEIIVTPQPIIRTMNNRAALPLLENDRA